MRQQLKELRIEIERADAQNWLYPEDGCVRGFEGRGPLTLVGYRPSTNPWPPGDTGRRRLYGTLAEFGFGEAHLSDCIKQRSRVDKDGDLPPNLDWHINVLRREVKLIGPATLIVFGGKATRFLRRYVGDLGVPLVPLMHYAYRYASEDTVLLEMLEGLLNALKVRIAGQLPVSPCRLSRASLTSRIGPRMWTRFS
jgi:hypothetical protein